MSEPSPQSNTFEATQMQAAWDAHRQLIMDEVATPSLANNPAWQIIRAIAYEQLFIAMEASTNG